MIKIEHAAKSYDGKNKVIEDIDLEIKRESFLCCLDHQAVEKALC